MRPARAARLAAGLAALCLAAACGPIIAPEQGTTDEARAAWLSEGASAGQTFVARQAGLAGVEVFLWPGQPGEGRLTLRLYDEVGAGPVLAEASMPLEQLTAPAYYRFSFEPLPDSLQRGYYAEWQVEGPGAARVGRGGAEAYLDGAFHADRAPAEAQAAFRLVYASRPALLGLAAQAAGWFGAAGLMGLLLLIPGLAVLRALRPGASDLPWPAQAGLALALGLGLYPLLLLWTGLAGLRLGPAYAWLPLGLGVAALAWQSAAASPAASRSDFSPARVLAWLRAPDRWADLAYLLLAALLVGTRFFAVRALEAPMWGDSVQHAMIAQLLVNHGGLFDQWAPYADLTTFTYHFAFHTAVAVYYWIAGGAMPQAVLWVAQALNVAAALALYPLAWRLGGSRWAGVAAVALAGLAAPMPMFYTNWGRFTQLAGQVILPAALVLGWEALEAPPRSWRRLGLACLTLSGLALAHYRVLAFAALILAAIWLGCLRRERLAGALAAAGLMALGTGLLALPWLARSLDGFNWQLLAFQLTTPPAQAPAVTQEINAIGDPALYLPPVLWLLLPLATGWGIWRRAPGVVSFSAGCLLVLLAANPQWLGLPGQGALSNFAVFIAAYLPLAVLAGAAVGWAVAPWEARRWGGPALLALTLAASLALAPRRLGDIRPGLFALVTRPDVAAAEWIRGHTPAEAVFLINSFPAYGGTVIVGADAGWWLPLLAGRRVSVPPINYSFEQGPRPDYHAWVAELGLAVQDAGPTDPGTLALLRQRGVTHVYIGQRQGRVNYSGPSVLDPLQLAADPHFRLVYQRDRVWIFELQW